MKQRAGLDVLSLVVSAALAVVALLVGDGFPVGMHWRCSLPFLFAWTIAAAYVCVANHAERRRAHSLAAVAIPYGVRLGKAGWVLLSDALAITQLGAAAGAFTAAFGHVGLSLGAVSVSTALALVVWRTELIVGVTAVAFESAGLRVYARGYEVCVPWKQMVGIDRAGKGTRQLLLIRVSNIEAAIQTLRPDTEANKRSVRLYLFDVQGRLIVAPWLGGLSAGVLARAVDEARSGNGGAVVN